MSIENLKTIGMSTPRHSTIHSHANYSHDPFSRNTANATDPFADADEETGETNQSQNYIHIRIQRAYWAMRCKRKH
jgi:hypothetical protein